MSIKQYLLVAPDSELDASAKLTIEKWDDEPTALQVLETLDDIVKYSSGSPYAIKALEVLLNIALMRENITYDKLVQQAHWRYWNK